MYPLHIMRNRLLRKHCRAREQTRGMCHVIHVHLWGGVVESARRVDLAARRDGERKLVRSGGRQAEVDLCIIALVRIRRL